MKINLLKPQGYCKGVSNALKKLDEALLDKTLPRPIYLLGEIIHNDYVINKYQKQGVILLSEATNSKEEHLKKISSGTIIFQAHGSSPECYQIAKEKNLTIIDATCPYVSLIHNKINTNIKNSASIIYVGKNNHSETNAALKQAPNINLVTSIKDLEKLNLKNENIYVTNQTTLSNLDLEAIFANIKEKYPQAKLDNKICDATTKRQLAVINQEPVDLCIVIGDPKSSNSKRLYELAKKKVNSIFISSVAELKNYDFSTINSVSITSGASTPAELVDEVVNFLLSLP